MAEKITNSDIKLLSWIAEYKFLTVKLLWALSQRSFQVIRRRLRFLQSENFVAMQERAFGEGPGRPENIVILTEKSIGLLKGRGILSNHAKYVTNATKDPIFISHDLLVNWFFIHLIQVDRDNQQISTRHLTISSHNLKNGAPDKPLLMEWFSIGKSAKNTHTMIPDGVFTITEKESEKSLLFFLEVDMNTETLVNTNRNTGDIRQKIINYQTLFRSKHYKRYEKIFGTKFNGFRLLFLTNTTVRMKALCRLIQEMRPSGFIWVAHQKQMFLKGISAEIWIRGGLHNQQPESILGKNMAFESTLVEKI